MLGGRQPLLLMDRPRRRLRAELEQFERHEPFLAERFDPDRLRWAVTEAAARRETREEADLELQGDLVPIQRYMPSPGASGESVMLFCGRVDSRGAGRSPGYLDVWSPRETQTPGSLDQTKPAPACGQTQRGARAPTGTALAHAAEGGTHLVVGVVDGHHRPIDGAVQQPIVTVVAKLEVGAPRTRLSGRAVGIWVLIVVERGGVS